VRKKKIKVSPTNSQFIFATAAYLLAKSPTKKVKKINKEKFKAFLTKTL
jgi:hypothetical protein